MRDTLIHLTGLVPDVIPPAGYLVLFVAAIIGACLSLRKS